MLSIKGATTQTFFPNVELVRLSKEFVSERKIFFVKYFEFAKSGYRIVSNFNNTKLEKL